MEDTPGNAIVSVFDNPVLAVTKPGYFDSVFAELRREAAELEIDLTTEKGRKAIAAMAFKVARTKTAIDDAGKALNDEARIKINVVDAARRDVREKLDAFKVEVRKPLTDWEDAEEKRLESVATAMRAMQDAALVLSDEDVEVVALRLNVLQNTKFDPDIMRESLAMAEGARDHAITQLEAAVTRLNREAADRAELDKLRAEAAARAEREAAEAQAKAEAAAKEAAAKAAQRAAEAAEEERVAALAKAADAARNAAEQAAETERQRVAEAHNAEIAAARAQLAEVERAAQAAAEAKAELERREVRLAAEEAVRVKNRAHRSAIQGQVKIAIMSCGIEEEAAKKVVLAIIAGQVPHTTIQF